MGYESFEYITFILKVLLIPERSYYRFASTRREYRSSGRTIDPDF